MQTFIKKPILGQTPVPLKILYAPSCLRNNSSAPKGRSACLGRVCVSEFPLTIRNGIFSITSRKERRDSSSKDYCSLDLTGHVQEVFLLIVFLLLVQFSLSVGRIPS